MKTLLKSKTQLLGQYTEDDLVGQGHTIEEINEWYGQENKTIKCVYLVTAVDTDKEDEYNGNLVGVEYEDGTFYRFGCRMDTKLENVNELIKSVLVGTELEWQTV